MTNGRLQMEERHERWREGVNGGPAVPLFSVTGYRLLITDYRLPVSDYYPSKFCGFDHFKYFCTDHRSFSEGGGDQNMAL